MFTSLESTILDCSCGIVKVISLMIIYSRVNVVYVLPVNTYLVKSLLLNSYSICFLFEVCYIPFKIKYNSCIKDIK